MAGRVLFDTRFKGAGAHCHVAKKPRATKLEDALNGGIMHAAGSL